MDLLSKIGLGTAQWGLRYGIANRRGQPSLDQIRAILVEAAQARVVLLDTASAYGDSERLLGELDVISSGFRVFTKTHRLYAETITKESVLVLRDAFFESLGRLRCDRVDGLLVHHVGDVLVPGGERIWELMETLKKDRFVSRIGVSVYYPWEVERLLDRFDVDVVQLPFNIYDQRFRSSGVLARLQSANIQVHARSALLQGLLVMQAEELPAYFDSIREHHARLHAKLASNGLSPVRAALLFCLKQPDIDNVIVGCETVRQLQEIVEIGVGDGDGLPEFLRDYGVEDERMLDPSRWDL